MAQQHDIFSTLKQDHDKHRALLARIDRTDSEDEQRTELFTQFTLEAKAHAAAEEQALYSTVMRKPKLTSEVRHSVSEHHEVEEMLNDLAATDTASDEWLTKFREMQHRYLHHIKEEEEEHFPDFAECLTPEDQAYMDSVFQKRKPVEKDKAEVTPEKLEDAKE